MDRLEQAFAGRVRGAAISLLFIDLDSFKTINDSLGHDRGDAVLTQVAGRLLAVVRSTDTVARIGGDEFVVLCGNADRQAALHVAERVLAALRPPLEVDGHRLPVTASIGVATAEEHDHTVSDLLRRADTSMYQAKPSGKNRAAC
jgi:diguanylate cyclase (GGDEF)-like protein